jgi:hypothetical protein
VSQIASEVLHTHDTSILPAKKETLSSPFHNRTSLAENHRRAVDLGHEPYDVSIYIQSFSDGNGFALVGD